jgi:branched-chain amino acid transport system ATP-binding protein
VSENRLLEVSDIRACYEGVEVLHGANLAVEEGTVTAVLGANGAGKSTLLAVVAGLHHPTEGEVRFDGHPITGSKADGLVRQGMCLVPEGRGVFPNLTVRENLWVMTHCGESRKEVESRAFGRFARLSERKDQLAGTLSGGEQQMLAMARAVVSRPKLLLLDELSMGLAPIVVQELYQHVVELANEGVTIVVGEQFAQTALTVATSGVVMSGGRDVFSGTSAQVESVLHSTYLGNKQSQNGSEVGAT